MEIDLHFQPRRRLVHQIDGLVGQEAVRDVAIRQGGCRHQRGVGDTHAVVLFVFVFQAAQDRDGVLDRWLVDKDRLEPARQRRVLFDVLAVFIQRGGANTMQFAPRQRGFQQIGRVHRAVRLAGADQRVHLVDEQDDAALGRRDLLQHRFQPFLELAAIFRTRDQRAEIERQQSLVLQAFRHVAVEDAQRQPLDDRGLADAGLADQHGIVLGAAGQHLDGAADFLVAADHRVELAVARRLRQVAGIFLQRVIGIFGRRGIRGAALAQGLDRGIEVLWRDTAFFQDGTGFAVLLERQPEQQPFDGDKAVAGLVGDLFRGVERTRQLRRKIDLPRAASGYFWQFVERVLGRFEDRTRIAAGTVDQTAGEALAVVQQHFEHMQRRELLVAVTHRQRLRRLDKTARTLGVFFNIHRQFPQPAAQPRRHCHGIFIGFPQAALTFLNQPAVVADAHAGLRRMWEQAPENGRGDFTNSCVRR